MSETIDLDHDEVTPEVVFGASEVQKQSEPVSEQVGCVNRWVSRFMGCLKTGRHRKGYYRP